MKCKNCDSELIGNFCSNCGQTKKVSKITWPFFLAEISDNIFQINRGLFYTLKELFVRPGQTIRFFIEGKRKNYFKPIAYAFTLSTLFFIIARHFESGTFISDAISGYSAAANDFEEGSRTAKIDGKILPKLNWFADNYAVTVLLLLPIFSLASYISFLKAGWNYLEHFVINAYITGQQAIIYSISALLTPLFTDNDTLITITLYISMIYNVVVFWQFFKELKRGAVILRTIATYLIYGIIFFIITSVLFILAAHY